MTHLLIDEPPLQVLPSLAVAVGLNEGIILQQIHYWIQHKRADPEKYGASFQGGVPWVYNSIPDWQKQFPFWSDRTIQRALESLRQQGLLIVAQLAADTRDRTNWYRIDYEALARITPPIEKPAGAAAKKADHLQKDVSSSRTSNRHDAPRQNDVMALRQSVAKQRDVSARSLTETPSENSQRNLQKSEGFASLFSEPEEPTALQRAKAKNPQAFAAARKANKP